MWVLMWVGGRFGGGGGWLRVAVVSRWGIFAGGDWLGERDLRLVRCWEVAERDWRRTLCEVRDVEMFVADG